MRPGRLGASRGTEVAKAKPLPHADMVFGKAVLQLKLVAHAPMEECAEEVRRLAKAGQPRSLAEVVVAAGLLTPEQYRQVVRKTGQLSAADMAFGRAVLEGRLASPNQVEACAEAVRRLLKAGESRSLADVMVEQGVLTAEQRSQVEGTPGGDGAAEAAPEVPEAAPAGPTDPRDTAVRKALKVKASAATFSIGGYTQLRFYGADSIGVVYHGVDAQGQPVAVKTFAATSKGDGESYRRFLRERRVVRDLTHPGIVRVLEVGMHGDVPYFVTEVLEGRPLDELLKHDRPGRDVLVDLVHDLAEALAYAHEKGVVHRELKPSSVVVRSADGSPVITDFGMAKDTTEEFKLTVGDAEWRGSPVYTAPEVTQDAASADARADVFTLGVLLYDACCGKLPWEGDSDYEIILNMEEEVPEPPSCVAPGAPVGLDAVCLRALAKDPEQRYRNARELARALAEAKRAPPPKPEGFLKRWTRRLFRRGASEST